jgi:uncharacterized membrane protein YgdD (TMEM256/DUF423 family)
MSSASPAHRFPAAAAGLAGLTGVALGAMGAHAWKAALVARGTLDSWHTAANYHLLHAVALLGLAAWLRAVAPAAPAPLVWAARCWVAGIVMFSGSIYWLAHGGPRWLGPVTPLGGVAFMAGWLLVATAALRREPAK